MNMSKSTDHATFRYAQRVKNKLLVNLNAYKAIEKLNPEKIKEWKNEIQQLFEKSMFVIQGAFDKKNTLSNFYLNKEQRLIFVVSNNNDSIITIYKVDYGYGDNINKITMNALLKEIEKLKKGKEKYISKYSKHLEQKEFAIIALEQEMIMLNSKIELINKQKNGLQNELDIYKDTVSTMTKEVESKSQIICHSIGYKYQDEFN